MSLVKIDTLITGARVIDGTGNPWFYGDVALAGETIAAVTAPSMVDRAEAGNVVDATGKVVCPGFIDIQSHSIVPLLSDGRSLSKVTQGVTTEIMGEDWTPAPFGGRIATPFTEGQRRYVGERFDEWMARAKTWSRFGDWLSAIEEEGASVNFGSFIGGSTVREFGMGHDMGEPSQSELDAMLGVLSDAMDDGAFGLATALIYPPGAFAGFDELVALCEVIARKNGVHISHIRSEEDRIIEALEEAIEIARRTRVSTEIYHLKAAGKRNWDKLPRVIEMINEARAEGLDVGADMYPYEAAGTGLAAVVPPWASEGDKLFENLKDPKTRARIREEMLHPSGDWENFAGIAGAENIQIASLGLAENKQYEGRRLSDIAESRGQDWNDAALDLLSDEGHDIFTFYFMMSEENLRTQIRQPWMKFGTDAGGLNPEVAAARGLAHPRAYGTYTRILGRFVREQKATTLEDAIRKMGSAVADRLGLRDRGLLRDGMKADVVVFDPETVTDHATYTKPHQLSTGIEHVWVNGTAVLRGGEHTGALPGQRVGLARKGA
jgi:dihydroorotase/N-acyl-D-amino-acid deacylase